jgi:pyrimidine-nucleoside phosphorylase
VGTDPTSDLRDLIAAKRDGQELSPAQIQAFVDAAATGSVPEVQLASMLMAVFLVGMTDAERTEYALAMMRSGEILSWDHLDRPTVDKHSTGGVGDKVSLVWAPLMAASGYAVPMISGRGLGHTGGTLDKLETLPGFRTDLDSAEMDTVLRKVGCVITGQTADMVPADRTLYGLRSRTATVPSIDHIAPSIMSKKLAEGAATLVLDVKVGSGAFMKTRDDARKLAEVMIAIGRGAGRNTCALLTTMDAPLGRAVGNAVEVAESIEVLRGAGPMDLRELVVDLATAAIEAAGDPNRGGRSVRDKLYGALDDGSALDRFAAMVAAQGGDVAAVDDPSRLLGADGLSEALLLAPCDGVVAGIDALAVGLAVADLGGCRGSDGSAPDPGVGAWLQAHLGEKITRGQPWARLLHRDSRGLDAAVERMDAALRVADIAPAPHRVLEWLP